jgi:hypothetical protein
VVDEVREGLLTPARARDVFGVAVHEDGSGHDPAETARLREAVAR